MKEDLAVVIYLFRANLNPAAARTFRKCAENLSKIGACWYAVEAAPSNHHFVLARASNIYQLKSHNPVWLKESLINWVVKKMPTHVTKVAFIDSDIGFEKTDWPQMASEALERSPVVQLFSELRDLDVDGYNVLRVRSSVALRRVGGHPGSAWAVRRELFTKYDGLFDLMVTGGGDSVMTYTGFYGDNDTFVLRRLSPALRDLAIAWGRKVYPYVQGNVGLVHQYAYHYWHGEPEGRLYSERLTLLRDIIPQRDFDRDENGFPVLTESASRLRRELEEYFHFRAQV